MSFLTRTALRSRTTLCLISNPSRPFHITSARAALSESDHNDDERKAKIEHHKEDQLNKQKEGKGHWKGELGSNSESAIKADRGEIHDAQHDTENLQKETSSKMQDDHEHGKK
ncbi:hypothetical protein JMJ35_005556 [Cladonia borealis]|uniref:Mitochondrial carrier protein pet8 n=1 Tax=Cladonia borealis TaxID=184061 RepID=A0AA39V1L6_9LECA|nr:hypothetical protein JMJ35_005556 [Cladonia borealis]